jgi:glycosyltransferase involved in cell wall biosynthesis
MLGDGSHRPYCEQLSKKLGLQNRVKFVGHVPHDQMREFYLEASVFAMPSVWPEPFGMAGPEAMRYGIPVVAFNAGGIREWLHDGENGFLAPWMDTDAFAARLQLLLTEKALANRLGRNGMAHVNRVYDSRSQVNRLEHLFRKLSSEGQYALKQRSSPTAGKPASAQSFKLSENQSATDETAVENAPVNAI